MGGQVWGDLGIAEGFEENDLKGYENFGKFAAAMQSTGVAATMGPGPYTIFAPTDPALDSYETMRGPITADIVKLHIVTGKVSSADVSSATLTSLGGSPLTTVMPYENTSSTTPRSERRPSDPTLTTPSMLNAPMASSTLLAFASDSINS